MTLYIHIPFCLKKCDYCDFFSIPPACENSKNEIIPNDYIEALLNQIEFLAKHFGVQEFQSVYVGGGTPSLLSTTQVERLCAGVKKAAPLAQNAEFTIEANPGDITREWLLAANAGGVNRLSVGIQCANDTVLQAVNRRTSVEQIKNAVQLIKTHWRGAWCADFIAGLPYQTREMLKADIDFAAANNTTHISLYSLTVEEGTPLSKKIAAPSKTQCACGDALPYNADAADELWLFGRDYLEQNGFMQYEISNFAKKGFQSRHNSAYWQLQDYLGAGAGAVGNWQGLGLQNSKGLLCQTTPQAAHISGIRYTNTRDVGEYIRFWKENYSLLTINYSLPKSAHNSYKIQQPKGLDDVPIEIEHISASTIEFEFLMMGLRTLRGVSAQEYARRFNGDLAKRLGADTPGGVFAHWQQKGLACTTQTNGETFYALTREGILFLNKFLEEI